jgi:succinate-semialdehyde dehydrogenase/glutarate-semialdehyde dehydrogenase
MAIMRSINPTTGELLSERAEHSRPEAIHRLDRAHLAWREWRERPAAERAEVLHAAAAQLRAHANDLARLATLEMGKPIAQAAAEVEKCAWVCDWCAEHGPGLLEDRAVASDADRSLVRSVPLGVVLAVMPWNFPFWQVFRAAAPALIAGNAIALKHASNVPGVALAIEMLWRDAALPAGVFTTLLVPASTAAELVAHPAIAAVTVTGSELAGVSLSERSGRALKKIVLELGGSDPFLVLADADLDHVVEQAVLARVQNNGQSCIAAKRFIVEAPLAAEFEARLVQRMRALVVGDPLDPATHVGPLARPDLVSDLDAQVRGSIAAGARLALGGTRLERPGFFYAPTVLADVRPGCPAFDEETFGPLAPVIVARDTDEAIALANRSSYGLGASVWTRDAARGEQVARAIEAGAVFVNGIVKSDPRLPFGGIKRSGHGRELGEAGLREFVNLQTLWVRER